MIMKNALLVITFLSLILAFSCNKDNEPGRFELLTAHAWTSDSLLVDGTDASGPGQLLENFKGDADFKKDGTGTFGQYTGTWRFAYEERKVVIESTALIIAVSANIIELTTSSLKITTLFPNQAEPTNPLNIRMTFKEKE